MTLFTSTVSGHHSMTSCKNCNHTLTGNFCSNCGQAAKLKRIDRHYVVHEVQHVLHFEKGVFFTIKELLIRPGQSIREFISYDRSRLVKPVIFVVISSLLYSLMTHFFHVEDGYITITADGKQGAPSTAIGNWIKNHYGYVNIILGVFIAFWLKLFFKKYDYNIFEIVILLCFVMGMGMLTFALFAIAEGFTKVNLMQISAILFFSYSTWAIGQFFDKRKAMSYVKAFSAYILGMITFSIVVLLLGYAADLIWAH